MKRAVFGVLLLVGAALDAGRGQEVDPLAFPRPSGFSAADIVRNPFLPIDDTDLRAQKKVMQASGEDSGGTEADDLRQLFSVTTISIGAERVAVINRQPFAEGDGFDIERPGKGVMPVKVLQINEGAAVLECDGVRVEAPLQRKDPKQLADVEPEPEVAAPVDGDLPASDDFPAEGEPPAADASPIVTE